MHKNIYLLSLIIIALTVTTALTQEEGETIGGRYVPFGEGRVITAPTAWTNQKGEFDLGCRLLPFLIEANLGITNYLTVGGAYGGANVIGYGKPEWNPRPCFRAKIQITQGGAILPAIALGYDDQGIGHFYESEQFEAKAEEGDIGGEYGDRFQIKSKGFYIVASQEYKFLGVTAFHIGVNYSITERKDDKDISVFGAIEKSISPDFFLLADYDFGMNDNETRAFGGKRGFLNVGVRWRVAEEFNLEFYLMNISQNQKDKLGKEGEWYRALSFKFSSYF